MVDARLFFIGTDRSKRGDMSVVFERHPDGTMTLISERWTPSDGTPPEQESDGRVRQSPTVAPERPLSD